MRCLLLPMQQSAIAGRVGLTCATVNHVTWRHAANGTLVPGKPIGAPQKTTPRHSQTPPPPPPQHEPPAILSCTSGLAGHPWTPLNCGMAGCWQINSILSNIGHKNSIRILNLHPFMKSINMNIICLFYKVFIILKIKVALIDCSWSKAPSKAAYNGLMALITAQLGVAQPNWGRREVTPITLGSQPQLEKLDFRHVLPMSRLCFVEDGLTGSLDKCSGFDGVVEEFVWSEGWPENHQQPALVPWLPCL